MYGRATQARRAWYARRTERRRRLPHPVISVGNLTSGGSGKTPVVAELARMLCDRGERPAILTRGYGRRDQGEGVVVVSDTTRVLEPVSRSGDEPQLLARQVPGVPVLVSADRFLSGSLAARHFGTTVSLLDDGFQHVQLERDADLVLVSRADLDDRVLPSGRLREPLDAARFADALLVTGEDDEVAAIAGALGHANMFRVEPRYAALRTLTPAFSSPDDLAAVESRAGVAGSRVLAFAGIARPERFFGALRALGHEVVREIAFRDHHWFSRRDLDEIVKAARASGASMMITTEKDAMRLEADGALVETLAVNDAIPIACLPMRVEITPAAAFEAWLLDRLARSRVEPSPGGDRTAGCEPAPMRVEAE